MQLKAKLILGFRKDQEHTIDSEELHKAYYAFMNPDHRVLFNDGYAIRGDDIRAIEPDYHATMGWNSTHTLDGDDWGQIRSEGVDRKLREIMAQATQVSITITPEKLSLPLSQLLPEEKKQLNA